jgi:hypothetical protein
MGAALVETSMNDWRRRTVLGGIAGTAAAVAGCLGHGTGVVADSGAEDGAGESGETAGPPTTGRQLYLGHDPGAFRDAVVSGGPGKDGIPSIDDPALWGPERADEYLDGGDVVFGVVRDGEARAYPQRVLVWHEICNDSIADTPLSITYCPLTGTALGFERGPTTFGVSGNLVNNNLVMYDRATDSRWPQIAGTAIEGEFVGQSLRQFPVVWSTWTAWRTAHPDTRVLSTETGFARSYDSDPYGQYNPRKGYYREGDPMFSPMTRGDRFPPKEVVLVARTASGAIAFRDSALRKRGVMTGPAGDTPVVAVYDPDLGAGHVYANPAGEEYAAADGGIRGPDGVHDPIDLPLERLSAFDGMYHAYAAFYPEAPTRG